MGGEQARVDARVLAVGLRGDGGDPLATRHDSRSLAHGRRVPVEASTARGYGRGVPIPLRALLDAAREGDDQAVAELVRRTQPDVWRLCVALGSRGEEEDLVQETYLRALGRSAPTAATPPCGRGCSPSRATCAPTTSADASDGAG